MDQDEEEEVESISLVERVGWILALSAGAVVGGAALYRRFATSQTIERVNAVLSGLSEAIVDFARAAYVWIIGPNGEYKDFVSIALVGSLFVWLVLWVLARIGRR